MNKIIVILKWIYFSIFYPIFKLIQRPSIDMINKSIPVHSANTRFGMEALLRKEILGQYKVLDMLESIRLLTQSNQSFIRLGDGEMHILADRPVGGMHKNSPKLKEALLEATYRAMSLNIPVGLLPLIVHNFSDKSGFFYACENLDVFTIMKYIPKDYIYFDATLFRNSPFEYYAFSHQLGGGRIKDSRV